MSSSSSNQKPKNVRSAFFLYVADQKQHLLNERKDLAGNVQEIVKILGERWKASDESVKNRYKDLSIQDKKRYEEEVLKFKLDGGNPDDLKRKKSKKSLKNQEEAPKLKIKKPASAYILFCNEARKTLKEKQPSLSFSETANQLSQLWKNCDAASKAKYEALAKTAKEEHVVKSEQLKRESATKAGNDEKRPKQKKAPSSYLLFCNEMRPKVKSENPDIKFIDMGKKLSELWKSCDADTKARFENLAKSSKTAQTN